MNFDIANAGRTALTATLAIALAACGGGGSSSTPIAVQPSPTPAPAPSPTPTGTATCSVQNQIAFSDDVLEEWYLFPDLLDNTVNPATFTTVQSFLNARVRPAREASRDKFFTFATSIADENALITSGSSGGSFGIRLFYDRNNDRVFLFEAFENGPAFAAGLDRGTELLSIGVPGQALQSVSFLMSTGGPQAVIDALGPSTAGVERVLRFRQVDGTVIEVTVAKADFSLDPVSDRYGALILNEGSRNIGYVNLRTFIVEDAVNQLRDAFELFNDNGVNELIIDFRYNGGGLVSVANSFGDLLGEGRVGQVFSRTILRESKSSENRTRLFETEMQSLQPQKIAFITTGFTASASELLINSMLPFVGEDNVAIIGTNTSGKPVGQFGFDFADCDLRVRAVTFQTVNVDNEGEYFDGLAGVVPNNCRAVDEIGRQLGDPQEASITAARQFLSAGTCTTPISGGEGQRVQSVESRIMLQPDAPSAAQFEIPGLF